MRARYYNPDIKRFMNRDVLRGDLSLGLSMNRFAYVNGNPVTFVDPLGLDAIQARKSGGMGDGLVGRGYTPVPGERTHPSLNFKKHPSPPEQRMLLFYVRVELYYIFALKCTTAV
nr:RHS repeat-associated core domain-containing protein [Paenibacillus lemnae]